MAGESQGARRSIGAGALVAWITCAAFVGAAADLMQPAGPFGLFLTAVFAVVAIVCALLSFVPPIRSLMRAAAVFALASVVLFGLFTVLQRVAAQPQARARGVIAAVIPGAEDVQRFLLAEAARREDRGVEPEASALPHTAPEPLSAGAQAMRALETALTSQDPAERVRVARETLASQDAAVRAAAVERLYRSGEPSLRQLAVGALLKARAGARMPLIAGAGPNGEVGAFAAALQAGGLVLRSVDVDTGGAVVSICGEPGASATIGRAGVTLSGPCRIGQEVRGVVIRLQAAEDFRLVGEARTESGDVASVELPLS
jgi:hypothetical protein